MGAKKKKGKGGKKGKSSEPRPEVSSAEQMAYKIQSLEAQLESARERVKRLGHDNEELRRTREKVEKDTHEFVAYFQKEMEKKDDLVADLRYNLRQAELSASRGRRVRGCAGQRMRFDLCLPRIPLMRSPVLPAVPWRVMRGQVRRRSCVRRGRS